MRWITSLPQWRKPKKKDKPITWVGPVLAGDRLILGNSRGALVNVAIADGSVGTTVDSGSPIGLQPVVANSTLYILDESGRLSAWR